MIDVSTISLFVIQWRDVPSIYIEREKKTRIYDTTTNIYFFQYFSIVWIKTTQSDYHVCLTRDFSMIERMRKDTISLLPSAAALRNKEEIIQHIMDHGRLNNHNNTSFS